MPFCLPSNIIIPPGRFRPVDYKSAEFKELVESIKSIGQLQSILVSKTPVFCPSIQEDQYELIDGLNRLEACRLLTRKVWFSTDTEGQLSLDDQDARKMAELHTGIRRIDFTPQQRSAGIAELHSIMQKRYGTPGTGGRGRTEGWTLEDTANKLGFKDKKTVQDAITIHKALESGVIPGIEKAKTQTEALKMVRDTIKRKALEEVTRRQAGSLVNSEIENPYEYFGNRLILGDCIKQMKQLDPNICDLFITDPPWNIDIGKKEAGSTGFVADRSLEEYTDTGSDITELLSNVIKEISRVGKPDCWAVMFCAAKHWTWLVERFRSVGFSVYNKPLVCTHIRPDGSIYKEKSPAPSIWPCSATDFMVLARKGNPTLYEMNRPDAFFSLGVSSEQRIHRAQKSIQLMKEIISRFYHPGTNPLLIDPFAGSGSTLVAARRVGIKNYFGYELSEVNRERAISYMVREYLEEQKPPQVSSELDLDDMPEG